ncbi:hypothetical protein BC332_33155 [Capsicum chinense]|nr:hypothetical protein BC332_33155 [Capsicum chinense]
MGISPSLAPTSRGVGPAPSLRTLLQTIIRVTEPPDSNAGLFWVIPHDLGLLLECRSAKGSWSLDTRWAIVATTKRVEIQLPLSATSVDVDSHLGQPRARGAWEASIVHPMIEARCEGATRCVMPRKTCPRPNSFGRNLSSNTLWFMGFYNSHQVSHFATFFIDARAEISIAESSPMKTLLRILLPLNDKVQWTSHDVAGSEPPTSPPSEYFTVSFNR